jgi:hypothetical protein
MDMWMIIRLTLLHSASASIKITLIVSCYMRTFKKWQGLTGHVGLNPSPLSLSENATGNHALQSGQTRSELAFSRLTTWFQMCSNQHGKCGAKNNGSLPHRVLFVGNQAETTVQLVKDATSTAPYACLSHR